MLTYNDLYEILRKEKYSENLQILPKKFIQEFKEYLKENKQFDSADTNPFSEATIKNKKQIENAIAIFKEIILKRKKKILTLVLVATETGIMKKDYENMLPFEQKAFEKMTQVFTEGDRELAQALQENEQLRENKMIIFKEEVEQFIDHKGQSNGPYKSHDLANLNQEIAQILVNEGKATFVDEK